MGLLDLVKSLLGLLLGVLVDFVYLLDPLLDGLEGGEIVGVDHLVVLFQLAEQLAHCFRIVLGAGLAVGLDEGLES